MPNVSGRFVRADYVHHPGLVLLPPPSGEDYPTTDSLASVSTGWHPHVL